MASKANATFEGRSEETTTPLPEAITGTDVTPATEELTTDSIPSVTEESTLSVTETTTDSAPTDAEGKE